MADGDDIYQSWARDEEEAKREKRQKTDARAGLPDFPSADDISAALTILAAAGGGVIGGKLGVGAAKTFAKSIGGKKAAQSVTSLPLRAVWGAQGVLGGGTAAGGATARATGLDASLKNRAKATRYRGHGPD